MGQPLFDFITNKAFRDSLESDYAEVLKCSEAASWKSVQVACGSIVEALLIDYLATPTNPPRIGKDPLKMDLAEAIEVCRSEKVLSDSTADLCTVVRSYRNLIHPGRAVRLGERAPNESSARIAVALIELITADIAAKRRVTAGPTAEQIVSKLQRDADSLLVFKHLLTEVSQVQVERLLLELLPAAYVEAPEPEDPWDDDPRGRFVTAYHLAFDSSPEPLKEKAASAFVKTLKEDDGPRVSKVSEAFFRATYLPFVPNASRALVLDHLVARAGTPQVQGESALKLIEGLGPLLNDANEVMKWLDPLVLAYVSSRSDDRFRNKVVEYLQAEMTRTDSNTDGHIRTRIDRWIKSYETRDNAEAGLTRLRKLRSEIDYDVPF